MFFCDNYQYNLPQYLFHAIRYSSDAILEFHHLGCFDTVFIHTEMIEKTGWFSGSQERNTPKILSSEIMILSSIQTLLKINLKTFYFSRRLFAKHHTLTSLCRIFSSRSRSRKSRLFLLFLLLFCFLRFLFIVFIVILILLKTTFWQIPIHSQSLVKIL